MTYNLHLWAVEATGFARVAFTRRAGEIVLAHVGRRWGAAA